MSEIKLIFANEEQRKSYEKFMKQCDEEFQRFILWGEKTPRNDTSEKDDSDRE